MEWLRAWSVVVLLCLVWPTDVEAQVNPKLLGIKVGLAHSSSGASGAAVDFGGDGTAGFVVGILGRRPLGPKFALQFELLAARRGANFDAFDRGFVSFGEHELEHLGVAEVRHTYLQAPITLQYVPPLGDVGLRVYVGPAPGTTVSCSPTEMPIVVTRLDFDLTDETTLVGCPMGADEFHVDLVGGALIDRPIGRLLLTLDVRYEAGLGRMEGRTYRVSFLTLVALPDFDNFSGFQATLGLGLPVDWR